MIPASGTRSDSAMSKPRASGDDPYGSILPDIVAE